MVKHAQTIRWLVLKGLIFIEDIAIQMPLFKKHKAVDYFRENSVLDISLGSAWASENNGYSKLTIKTLTHYRLQRVIFRELFSKSIFLYIVSKCYFLYYRIQSN